METHFGRGGNLTDYSSIFNVAGDRDGYCWAKDNDKCIRAGSTSQLPADGGHIHVFTESGVRDISA